MVGLPLRNNNRSLMPSLQVLLLPLACVASAAAATDEQSRQGSRVQQPDDAATTATSQGPEDSRSRRLQEAAGGPSAQAVLLDLKADLEAGWTHNLLESWTAETVSSPLLRHVLGSIAFGRHCSASSSAGALRQGFLRQSGRGVDVRAVQRSLAGWQADDTVRAAHFWPDTLQPQC